MRATNKDNNSALKRLVPAVAMLALSAVTLSTSTYAWFTMNKSVEMTGINMTAATGEGMEISLASVTGDATNGTLKFLPASGGFTENDGKNHPSDDTTTEFGWKNTIVMANYYSDVGTLIPASSCDGKTFFAATDATNNGKLATKFESIALGSGKNATITPQTSLGSATALTSTGTSGYYVDIPVHLRTSKVGENKSGDIYYQMIINNNNASDTNSSLYKAVRVAFINGVNDTATAASKILTGDTAKEYYKSSGASAQAVSAIAADGLGTWGEVSNLSSDFVNGNTFDNTKDGADSGLKIPYATKSGEYGHLDFTVRIWLEGESQSCWDSTAGQEWNISLKFTMVDPNTTSG